MYLRTGSVVNWLSPFSVCSVLLSISTVSWTCTHVRSARGHVLVRARPALARVLLHVMVLPRVLLARLL